ncbi:hypothetical protein Agabi119p4_7537 [Agaricus bisporus var. burnettii]|uniref:PAS domain-containing protein n=1 Tax=Agaricus bisporus var. burnettii TaxID=192524 RepID=A0A8H7C722_AGABI|nr:hypothetical protein Agabi119p4_7537 [Agaricus bisporus var. burnettii]
MDSTPCVSFIGIVDFSQEARWIYMTDSVTDLLGYEPRDLVGRPSLELVHPDEFGRVRQLHYDTIQQDKAAVLVYLRMRHKDPYKGYILCGISRTVVHNVLVGSVSFASPGAKALQNASTAQEITVISPTSHNFQFRRWHDPSPMPPDPGARNALTPSPAPTTSPWATPSPRESTSPTQSQFSDFDDHEYHSSDNDSHREPPPSAYKPPASVKSDVITFDHLPNQSFRTAFILDRFSMHCTILYCSNDLLISTTECVGRSFFDYVAKRDEVQVRSWVDCVKGWGVNERGQPSDGGFGFGKFLLVTEGRDSIGRMPDPAPTSKRSRSSRTNGHHHGSSSMTSPTQRHRPKLRLPVEPELKDNQDSGSSPTLASMNHVNSPQFPVDAIFSAHSDGLMVILRRATA